MSVMATAFHWVGHWASVLTVLTHWSGCCWHCNLDVRVTGHPVAGLLIRPECRPLSATGLRGTATSSSTPRTATAAASAEWKKGDQCDADTLVRLLLVAGLRPGPRVSERFERHWQADAPPWLDIDPALTVRWQGPHPACDKLACGGTVTLTDVGVIESVGCGGRGLTGATRRPNREVEQLDRPPRPSQVTALRRSRTPISPCVVRCWCGNRRRPAVHSGRSLFCAPPSVPHSPTSTIAFSDACCASLRITSITCPPHLSAPTSLPSSISAFRAFRPQPTPPHGASVCTAIAAPAQPAGAGSHRPTFRLRRHVHDGAALVNAARFTDHAAPPIPLPPHGGLPLISAPRPPAVAPVRLAGDSGTVAAEGVRCAKAAQKAARRRDAGSRSPPFVVLAAPATDASLPPRQFFRLPRPLSAAPTESLVWNLHHQRRGLALAGDDRVAFHFNFSATGVVEPGPALTVACGKTAGPRQAAGTIGGW